MAIGFPDTCSEALKARPKVVESWFVVWTHPLSVTERLVRLDSAPQCWAHSGDSSLRARPGHGGGGSLHNPHHHTTHRNHRTTLSKQG